MKRFSFRLQRVLDLREQIRDELRQELVRRNQERDHEVHVLEDLEAEYLRIMIREGGTYSAGDLVMFGDYRERLKSGIEEQRERVIAAQKIAAEALERYVEASKEAKALEMLRQRREAEYTQGILKEEGAQLDEVAVQRAPGRDEERF